MTDDVNDAWERILGRLQMALAGRFEILREIGSGGMAAVYLAREIGLERQVAIKVMSPALLTGKGMVDRFRQEARTIAKLDHPNIITIYTVGDYEDLHYFVMKFIKGRSLGHIIRTDGPLPIPMVRGLLHMVGIALGHAHGRGVIHRDVKPANILIDGNGEAIVTDFGIAKTPPIAGQAHSAIIIGTPEYMSPEQCYARPATAAADQYSLGVVAYEMVTGRPPFTGSQFVVMEAHTKLPPPPIRDLRRDCPPDLEAAIMRMLAKDPSERWPSLHHALAELGAAAVLDGHPMRLALAKLGIPEDTDQGGPETARKPYVASVAILASPGWMETGDELTLRASARSWSGDTMPGISILWSTNTPSVAAVDKTAGTIVGVSPGMVTITASFEDVESSVTLQVVPRRVAAVTVSVPPDTIRAGDLVQLEARLEDKRGKEVKRSVAWITSDSKVVTVSDAGVLRALAPGMALAFAEADGVRGSVEIRVAPAPVAEVRPTMAPGSLFVGHRVVLGAQALGVLNNVLADRAMTWASGNDPVATITPDGLVTAVSPGHVEFTCTCEGRTAVVALNVEGVVAPVASPPLISAGEDQKHEPSVITTTEEFASAAEAFAGGLVGVAVESGPSLLAKEVEEAFDEQSVGHRAEPLPEVDLLNLGVSDESESSGVAGAEVDPNDHSLPATPGEAQAVPNRGVESSRHQRSLRRHWRLIGGVLGTLLLVAVVLSQVKPRAPKATPLPGPLPPPPPPETVVTPPPPTLGAPADVEITMPGPLRVGDTTTFLAVVRDSMDNTLTDSVRWASTRPDRLKIEKNTGLARAKDTGWTEVQATVGPVKGAEVPVQVLAARGRPERPLASSDTEASPKPNKAKSSLVGSSRLDDDPCGGAGLEFQGAINNVIDAIKRHDFNVLTRQMQPAFLTTIRDTVVQIPGKPRMHCRQAAPLADTVFFIWSIDDSSGKHEVMAETRLRAIFEKRGTRVWQLRDIRPR